MSIDLSNKIRVLLFNENGRLLYDLNPENCPQPQEGGVQQLDSNNAETIHQNISSISECVFGSVSIQSPPDVCITRIHKLSTQSLMTSLVFDIKTTSTTNAPTSVTPNCNTKHPQHQHQQQTRSQKDLIAKTGQTNNDLSAHNNDSSSYQQRRPSRHRTSSSTTNGKDTWNIVTSNSKANIRKKLGIALIWYNTKNSASVIEQLDVEQQLKSNNDTTSFVLNHIKAIDMYLGQLKNNIVNSSPALKSKTIHDHIRTCLNSINSYANSRIVANLSRFNRNDYVEEFVSVIDEFDNKGLHSILVGILSVFHDIDDLNGLQIIFCCSSAGGKALSLRVLFLLYCFIFDTNLDGSLWESHRGLSQNFGLQGQEDPTCPVELSNMANSCDSSFVQTKDFDAQGLVVIELKQLDSSLTPRPPCHHLADRTKPTINSQNASINGKTTIDKNSNTLNCNNNNGEDLLMTTCDLFEIVEAPRDFSTVPLHNIKIPTNNLRFIYEPIITNSYILPAALQCIMTEQVDVLVQQLLDGSQNSDILRVDCDSWSLKMISKGQIKPVCQSNAINDLMALLKSLRRLGVDPTMLLDLFYCKMRELCHSRTFRPDETTSL